MALTCLAVALPGHASVVLGEAVAEKPVAEEVTVELIQNRLAQLENATTLEEPVKDKVRESYQQAQKELEAAAGWAGKAKRYEQMAAAAPAELTQVKADLKTPPQQPTFSIPEDGLLQLEQTLSQKQGELEQKKAEFATLEAEPQRRASRRVEIPKLTAGLRERIAEIDGQLQAAAAEGEPSEMIAARRLLLLARRRAGEQELLACQQELRAYEVRAELLPLRRDLTTRQVTRMEQEVTAWQNAIKRQRDREVEAQLRDAQQKAEQAHPAIARLTQQNAELAERRKALAQLIVQTTAQLDSTTEKLTTLRDEFTRIQGKVDTVGLTNAIGHLLRMQREAMPDLRSHRRNIKSLQVEIGERQFELLKRGDRRSDLADVEAQIWKELRIAGHAPAGAGNPSVASRDEPSELEIAARDALETEKEYLGALIGDLDSYFDKLVELDSAERQLIKLVEEYSKYIDERVLWIRSAPSLDLATFGQMTEGGAWLLEPKAWLGLARGLLVDATGNPLLTAMAVLLFAPLLWTQRRLRKRIAEIGETASRANCCSVIPTVEAAVVTLLIAVVVPGMLWFVSWRLGAGVNSSEFSKAVAAGLAEMAGVYLLLNLLQQTCRTEGLSEAHFGWVASALKPLRRYTRAAKLLILPPVFLSVTMGGQDNERWADSLGRLGFVTVMLVSALLILRSLRPTGGILQAVFATRRSGWIDRLRCVWYPAAVLLPLTLAVLALAGYFFTAEELARRLLASAYVLLALTLVRSLLLRWVLVKRRKLAIEQLRQRRATNQADGKASPDSDAPLPVPTPVEQDLDLATINTQTRRLVEHCLVVAGLLGIGLVWADVLPALRILDGIPLWQMAGQAEAVSLADLGLAILLGAITVAAAKNVPGLLEMAVLQHLPLDVGLRYTIRAVSRYLIVVVGLVAACNTIGLGWAKVQWLIAAVSVGLGFGLQEIFANFISGLIILFEQPVRVGDIVTVDGVTGVISRIRMRATTITNWDRKEFIVPNKEFVTGRVLNWTLTDQINRVVLNVGIAYGSDTDRAAELLMAAAREHPVVLDDPAPRVTFEQFGDSALNFVLRCYLPDLENRLQVIHDLHSTVDRRFREAGIEIAFPQHDVHIRSVRANQSLFERVLAGEDRTGDRKVA